MQDKELQLQTDEQIEAIAYAKQALNDKFPTRQQRRAEERKRRKAATKKQVKQSTHKYI